MPIHDWTRAPSGMFHHFHTDTTGNGNFAVMAPPTTRGVRRTDKEI